MSRFLIPLAILLLTVCWHVSIGSTTKLSTETAKQTSNENTICRIDNEHLPNAIRLNAKLISGGMPEGKAAFGELQELGVQTIISVDGKTPNVEAAKKHNIRYVHLPLRYDGISQQRVKELAVAITQLNGPIYIHCHRGKHRAPAAAAVACLASGEMTQADTSNLLALAGTSSKYRGLFQAVERTKPLSEAVLKQVSIEFPESVEVPPIATAMVAIEQALDDIHVIEASGWLASKDWPELDAAEEALLLREHFVELMRSDSDLVQQPKFKQLLLESIQAALDLEEAIRETESNATIYQQKSTLSRFSASIEAKCTACHQQFRDVTRKQH